MVHISFGPYYSVGTLPFELSPFATAIAATYSLYYISMEPFAGSLYSFVLTAFLLGADYLRNNSADGFYLALGVHVFAWIAQFIGHGVFEGRAPTLFDSIHQAFLLAPLFAWLEVFFMMGYRPDLRKQMDDAAKANIAEWKASKDKKGR